MFIPGLHLSLPQGGAPGDPGLLWSWLWLWYRPQLPGLDLPPQGTLPLLAPWEPRAPCSPLNYLDLRSLMNMGFGPQTCLHSFHTLRYARKSMKGLLMYTTEQQKMLPVGGGFAIKYTRIEGSNVNFHSYTQTSNLYRAFCSLPILFHMEKTDSLQISKSWMKQPGNSSVT